MDFASFEVTHLIFVDPCSVPYYRHVDWNDNMLTILPKSIYGVYPGCWAGGGLRRANNSDKCGMLGGGGSGGMLPQASLKFCVLTFAIWATLCIKFHDTKFQTYKFFSIYNTLWVGLNLQIKPYPTTQPRSFVESPNKYGYKARYSEIGLFKGHEQKPPPQTISLNNFIFLYIWHVAPNNFQFLQS